MFEKIRSADTLFAQMKILDFKNRDFCKQLELACLPASANPELGTTVQAVIDDVRRRGDAALFECTLKFDGVEMSAKTLKVSKAETAAALKKVSAQDKAAIKAAIANVKFFNARTKPRAWRAKNPDGAVVGENFYPIERVGLYIPGGQAPLVSTVVMTAALARIAGCPQICVCTPPAKDGSVNAHLLAALSFLGITEIYKAGGAQAIAAMGLGTRSVTAVDKLFGPGNAFVIEAKRRLFGEVGCDLLPGPSEVLILSDASANPAYIAADLLSQAEHGSGKEKIYFVTTSNALIGNVGRELARQTSSLAHAEKLMKILDDGCYAIIAPNLDAAVKVANYVAPEHMEIHLPKKTAQKLLPKITTAGALLVGENTPTALGDFVAGPSHTLPTGRTGRFSGGLQVCDFMRRSSFVEYTPAACKKALRTVSKFAEMEGLDAHGRSLSIRTRK